MSKTVITIQGESAAFFMGDGKVYGYPRAEGEDYEKPAAGFCAGNPSLNHTIQAAKEKQAKRTSAPAESRRRKEPAR